MEPADGPKEEPRRRRRRRPSDSATGPPLENSGAHSSTDTNRGSSVPLKSNSAALTPSEEHHARLGPLSRITGDGSNVTSTRSPSEAGESPHASSDTRRHTGKRQASGEIIHREEESKTTQPVTPQGQGNEIRRPDLLERAVVSPSAHSTTAHAAESPSEPHGSDSRTPVVAEAHTSALPLRVSTRRTTTTTRWSPSMVGGRDQSARTGARRTSRSAASQQSRGSVASPGSATTPPVRPISNATRNISFSMLQPHFERPLQQAADSFGVCTTLLKKICRRNGISNWPYRKICGLRKSIASMAKQVNYFDGEQKRAYADQLEKLERELQSYLRTGNEPSEEFLQTLDEEEAAAAAAATTTTEEHQARPRLHTAHVGNEEEEKEARAVPIWTARPSIAQPPHSNIPVVLTLQELQTTLRRVPATAVGVHVFGGAHSHPQRTPLQPVMVPTIATHHRALPSIASILQHQSYSSPSRAASTQDTRAAPVALQHDQGQQPQWRYFPPTNDDGV
ncbi:unnamed protein product [Phytophthora lilii]|uniref:Unnamed protein product n=1 Tax=Phytophthora lilii TaxID=2077276 RepID=A0A9W6WS49_9STRA|nr:unnamed protein product [Phytophthora lilii]